ncbi:MAG: 50S ribosomal protein L25/general stress protein Ctc, partial [Gammaproteobacteria bacterium]|nr:50S ribosomal protein L25/general stress protein Ctc [Gammaproteobacteria bacterium]
MTKKHEFALEATSRSDIGKGASRRLRRIQESIPAVVYGAGKPAQSITLSHNHMLAALEHEGFASHLIALKIDGKKEEKVLLKGLQRHPFKPKVLHADFLRVRMDVAIHVHSPLHVVGADECPGVKEGGVVTMMLNDIEISCLPKDLPEFLEIDISEAPLNATLHLSNLKLPEGVTIVGFHADDHSTDKPILGIHIPKEIVEEEPVVAEEAAEGEEAGEAAEGE